MREMLGKVTALITRYDAGDTQLLVFDHPTAGTQLPAGTIEPDEAPEAAVLRETFEETGLAAVRLVRLLDSAMYDLPNDQIALLQNTPLYTGPNETSVVLERVFERGWPLHLVRIVGEWAEVSYEEYNTRTTPPTLLHSTTGWLSTHILTTRLQRHFFHLISTAPTPASWELVSDGGRTFRCHWEPLNPPPQLVDRQQEWLERVYDRLVRG